MDCETLIVAIITFNISHHPGYHHQMSYPSDFKPTSKEGVAFQLQKLHFCKRAKGLFRFCMWAFEKLNLKTNICWRNWLPQALLSCLNNISLIMLFLAFTFFFCTQFTGCIAWATFPLMKSSFQIESEIKGTLVQREGNWEIGGNGVQEGAAPNWIGSGLG